MSKTGWAAIIVLAISSSGTAAHADQWPTHSIKMVVPYGAGGGVDGFTRPVAAALSARLGQPVVTENRPGAGGTIGVRAVTEAQADGYTLLAGGVHQAMAEPLYPQRGYDLDKDFVPIAITAVVPNVLIVHPSLPFTSTRQLIDYARKNPNKLTYCSAGSGTAPHVIAEMFKIAAGVDILHIPHTGTSAAYTTLLGGHCDIMFDGMGTAAAQIRAKRVRPLSVTTSHRSTLFPDIPTMPEDGGPPMDTGTWYGAWAPAGTPAAVVSQLNREIVASLKADQVQEVWKSQGAEVPAMGPQEVQRFVSAEIARWIALIDQASLKAN